ncbi:tetratricopeptide repeat protein 39C-like isoform X6 [Tenebrio molitor]|uniref:tetratricopeptide repeat protein 39C-like isoform X6 n=1 Tax=Tenebrio molitor TaxID=7067 RepID=UPI00362489C9
MVQVGEEGVRIQRQQHLDSGDAGNANHPGRLASVPRHFDVPAAGHFGVLQGGLGLEESLESVPERLPRDLAAVQGDSGSVGQAAPRSDRGAARRHPRERRQPDRIGQPLRASSQRVYQKNSLLPFRHPHPPHIPKRAHLRHFHSQLDEEQLQPVQYRRVHSVFPEEVVFGEQRPLETHPQNRLELVHELSVASLPHLNISFVYTDRQSESLPDRQGHDRETNGGRFFRIRPLPVRQNGISCLMYAREGIDMRAPLATLSLLWYHTIVRPFYALDGSNVQAGVNAATQLLNESETEYGESALFLFFKGRVNRLKSDIPTALKSFQSSVDNAAQREIKILALHEVGWCHLIQLDYCSADSTFTYLKSWSRWSRAFYNYLAAICCGSCENATNYTNIKEIKTSLGNGYRNNQLDEFLARRAKCCPSDDDELSKLPSSFWRLLVYEMLYLWNALPSCSVENLDNIKKDCEKIPEGKNCEPMLGLSKLILGCCYCTEKEYSRGIETFRLCLEQRKNVANNAADIHISAFTQYELATLLIKTNETKAEGKVLLQNISQYKDYDFEHRLNVRVHSLLKHL